MLLKKLTLHGFKSFAKKSELLFDAPVTAIVGPNGSGKSNVVESIRFVLGEQSSKSLRSKSGADIPFAGSAKISKMNRAKVAITFDNSNRVFQLTNAKNEKVSVDFDEVTLAREVYSDGSNIYSINGHDVRLRDIHEVIANVNIGSSGHHIISQGEADRLLNANAKDRKEMIEEALGLKVYHFRIHESRKKMEKTQTHMHETMSMQRELGPHLTYLEKQVEKIKEAEALRATLQEHFTEYLSKQSAYVTSRVHALQGKEQKLEAEKKLIDDDIDEVKKKLDTPVAVEAKKHVQDIQDKQSALRRERDEVSRHIGKIEGMIEMSQRPVRSEDIVISQKDFNTMIDELMLHVDKAGSATNLDDMRAYYKKIHEHLSSLKEKYADGDTQHTTQDAHKELTASLQQSQEELRTMDAQLQELVSQQRSVEADIEAQSQELRTLERTYFEYTTKRQDVQSQLQVVSMEKENIERDRQRFADDYAEAQQLFGGDFSYTEAENPSGDQNQLRRTIERMIVKLEETGGGSGADTINEYLELQERHQFLSKELEDLRSSLEHLENVIAELNEELSQQFSDGMKKITSQFNQFFSVLFGGGTAGLKSVLIPRRRRDTDEEEPQEDEGIDIAVSLPRKKVTDLDMLSGGERSLTSIALLFALSQVNPPPFLVLDETDAALDEANSTRYGDMLEELSKYSQLIVVTHNRETMSRANILYGVTMGRDECSELLSVKFDEAAAQFAK